MKRPLLYRGLAVIAAAVFVAVFIGLRSNNEGGRGLRTDLSAAEEQRKQPLIEDCGAQGTVRPATLQQPEAADEPDEEPMTAEEKAEAEEEKRVDDFDNLTDKWQEPVTNGVTMADVDAFVKQFETVPKDRKEECLQRALNLIPDENVMLLVGVLLDKSQDKELVELVFNDILNRDEDVKQPILQQILKDKEHPCWKDAAWILDVQEEEQ